MGAQLLVSVAAEGSHKMCIIFIASTLCLCKVLSSQGRGHGPWPKELTV